MRPRYTPCCQKTKTKPSKVPRQTKVLPQEEYPCLTTCYPHGKEGKDHKKPAAIQQQKSHDSNLKPMPAPANSPKHSNLSNLLNQTHTNPTAEVKQQRP